MTNIEIEIVSDPVCPWCHIGRNRLEKAMNLYRKVYPNGRSDKFVINWKAFYLDPTAPVPGIPWDERAAQRVAEGRTGGLDTTPTEADVAKAASLKPRLANIGQMEGMKFAFQGRIGKTKTAHRAALYAAQKQSDAHPDVQDRFSAALLKTFFESPDPFDITSTEDLADVLASVGLDRSDALAFLNDPSEPGAAEVDAEAASHVADGVRGVPVFKVGGRVLDGAQDQGDLFEAFVRAKEEATNGE